MFLPVVAYPSQAHDKRPASCVRLGNLGMNITLGTPGAQPCSQRWQACRAELAGDPRKSAAELVLLCRRRHWWLQWYLQPLRCSMVF